MEELKLIKIKDTGSLGVLVFPSRVIKMKTDLRTGETVELKSLNNVRLEDDTTTMIGDDEFEIMEEE